MKKFILGIIIGQLMLGIPILAEYAGQFDIEEADMVFTMNCQVVEFEKPVYSINGSTYVPVREFCEQAGLAIDWHRATAPGQYPAKKEDIKIVLPYVKAKEILSATVSKEDEFLSSDDLAKIERSEVETRIQTAEEAVRLALYYAESNEGARVYDNAVYDVFYLEEYDWWCVTFAGRTEINIYINPSSEWPYCVILSGDGELVYESPVYDIGNGKEKAKIWQQLEAEKREIQPLWE